MYSCKRCGLNQFFDNLKLTDEESDEAWVVD